MAVECGESFSGCDSPGSRDLCKQRGGSRCPACGRMMAPGRTNFRMSSQLALEPGLGCSMSWIYTSAACGLVCLSPDLVVTVKFISRYCTSVTVLESRRRRSLSPRWSLRSLSSVVCRFLPGRCGHYSSLTLVITDQWLLGS